MGDAVDMGEGPVVTEAYDYAALVLGICVGDGGGCYCGCGGGGDGELRQTHDGDGVNDGYDCRHHPQSSMQP